MATVTITMKASSKIRIIWTRNGAGDLIPASEHGIVLDRRRWRDDWTGDEADIAAAEAEMAHAIHGCR